MEGPVIRSAHAKFSAQIRFAKPRAVIFDMDGVIIDSHPAHRKAWRLFLRSIGKEVSDQELTFILDGHKRNDILRHFLGELPEPELAHYGEVKDEFFQRSALEVKPLPGILSFLQHLRLEGILLGLATSASASRTSSTLDQMDIRHLFSAVVTAADVEEGKPDPAVYRLACARLNINPNHVLVFEDAVPGIQAGKEAGLRCAGVACFPRSRDLLAAGADFVIENFTGLSMANLQDAGFFSSKESPTL